MCGIAGFIDYRPKGKASASAALQPMIDSLVHRGPDADGVWVDDEGRVSLGHRRLAIIDLSEAGAQPMNSSSGRYSIVFNGEIFGFLDTRRKLAEAGVAFRGHSDTEVLLEAIEREGIETAIANSPGMFALALYDRKTREVTFVRDRLGKKPLYIGVGKDALFFGSELKALLAHPGFSSPSLDQESLGLYVRYGYVPSPRSIFENVIKLPPGACLTVSVDRAPASSAELLGMAKTYWTAHDTVASGLKTRIADESQALEAFERVLDQAIQERLVSDVPLGVFLSGGIDSSLIAAKTEALTREKPRTLTIRFGEDRFNEADFAADIARHLGTQHLELTLTPQAALDAVQEMPDVFDEPLADPSQLPTLLVSRLAREHVTVVLSGDGGDEILGGYGRYAMMLKMERLARRVPSFLPKLANAAPTALLDGGLRLAGRALPQGMREQVSGDRIGKLAEILRHGSFRERYREFISQWHPDDLLKADFEEAGCAYGSAEVPAGLDHLATLMYLDTVAYLPDDVLVKVDRASMASSLEVRSPLLDHRVLAMAWRMPEPLRVSSDGVGKIALRRILEKYVPRELFDRPKQGFSVPINDWLRGPLREFAGDMLSSDRISKAGLFDHRLVDRRWSEHQSGQRNWGQHLWTLIMFEMWRDRWGVGS
ncbi:asparagine synthase (glutamine-hydrolyzing) [Aurantiacibacter hainanensis]|uniref:asparagine synthase (glutamine-hydrolyzing) n=1 Tax=Aurantiacibacter hainanensis TaxID=3076114 RepID=UPI0030C66B89